MGKSRRHEWLSECLGHLVMGIAWHWASLASRRAKRHIAVARREAGLEGDRDVSLRRPTPSECGDERTIDFSVGPAA